MTMIHALLPILLAVVTTTYARFDCPPAARIYPCQCRTHPQQVVRCDDVSSLASVRASLEGQFNNTTMPRLQLTNVQSFSLPSRALGELAPRRFYLSESNIRYVDEDAFEGQSSLGLLVLAEDRLEDIPVEALRRLTSLRTLSLADNFLMRVQEGSLNILGGLRTLILSENRISQIDKKAFPKNLESLTLSRNILSTLNGSLKSLEHLEQVFVTDNRLTSLGDEFNGLTKLKHLHLDRNHIWDISDSFSDLPSLASLSLSGNRILDVGKGLMGLAQLKMLNLSRNYITELHWRMFEKLKDLQVLDLSGNYLKSVCPILKPLRSLQELNLSDLDLKTLQPDCFHNMKFLKRLDLSNNRLTNTEAVSRHPLPALTYLRLDHNQLTALRYELKYAKNLKELDISFNNFTSLKAHYLMHNRELATLKMEGNPWKCTELTMLMLRDLEQRGVELQGRPDC